MTYSKSFNIKGVWKRGVLHNEEEKRIERETKRIHDELLADCIDRATAILDEKFKDYDRKDVINIALALFDKSASHVVFHKDEVIREALERYWDGRLPKNK